MQKNHKMMQNLKKSFWVLLSAILLSNKCKADYSTIEFSSLKERSKALISIRDNVSKHADLTDLQRAMTSKSEPYDKEVVDYFRALPDDFESFYKLYYGYSKDYDYLIDFNIFFVERNNLNHRNMDYIAKEFSLAITNSWSIFILRRMSKVIPKKIFFKKIISLGIGGFWSSDEIREIQGMVTELIEVDINLFVETLEKYDDDQIASLWYFIFDAPHPSFSDERLREIDKLYEKLYALSPRVAKQMKRAFDHIHERQKKLGCALH